MKSKKKFRKRITKGHKQYSSMSERVISLWLRGHTLSYIHSQIDMNKKDIQALYPTHDIGILRAEARHYVSLGRSLQFISNKLNVTEAWVKRSTNIRIKTDRILQGIKRLRNKGYGYRTIARIYNMDPGNLHRLCSQYNIRISKRLDKELELDDDIIDILKQELVEKLDTDFSKKYTEKKLRLIRKEIREQEHAKLVAENNKLLKDSRKNNKYDEYTIELPHNLSQFLTKLFTGTRLTLDLLTGVAVVSYIEALGYDVGNKLEISSQERDDVYLRIEQEVVKYNSKRLSRYNSKSFTSNALDTINGELVLDYMDL